MTAKQYLKKVAKNIYQHHELSDFNEVRLCNDGLKVHVHTGLQELAIAAGKKVRKRERRDKDYPIYLSFNYKGIEFFQIHH